MEKIGDKTVNEIAQMTKDEIGSWYDKKTEKTRKGIDKKFRGIIRGYDDIKTWLDVLIKLKKRCGIPSYWKIGFTYRKGDTYIGGDVWDQFMENSVISIGYDKGDKQFKIFSEDIKRRDKVVAYRGGKIYGICEVVGNYKPAPEEESGFEHTRKVKWLNVLFEGVPSRKLSDELRKKLQRPTALIYLDENEFGEIEKKVKESEREWKQHSACKILTYPPTNESGVIFLFGKYFKELGFDKLKRIERQRHRKFFDATVIKNGKPIEVEFETRSKSAKEHGNRLKKECDLIVCWENNWPECPINVLELRSKIKRL
jgi:hypothetical protein